VPYGPYPIVVSRKTGTSALVVTVITAIDRNVSKIFARLVNLLVSIEYLGLLLRKVLGAAGRGIRQ